MTQSSSQHGVSRREFLTLALGAFVVSAVPFASRRVRLVRRTVPVMGTVAELGVVSHDPLRAQAAIDAAYDELRRVERLMTNYSVSSDIGRANLDAARRAVPVSRETAAVVREALAWAEASGGSYDPAIGKAIDLWDVKSRRVPPTAGQYEPLAGRRLHHAVELTRAAGEPALRFAHADAKLDLGGIAKGYGIERAVETLRAFGVENGLVNIGGDLYAMGHNAEGKPWRVGVQSPTDPDGLVAEFEVSDESVATSGDYMRYFDYEGRRYHHILDPFTASPRLVRAHSLTVRAAGCMLADVAATTVYGKTDADAARILRERAPGAYVYRTAEMAAAGA